MVEFSKGMNYYIHSYILGLRNDLFNIIYAFIIYFPPFIRY